MAKQYETVIGLEVHVELATRTKIFCGCSTAFGGAPNTHTCPVCTGMPGSLPVLNKQVVEYAIGVGLATGCTITRYCKFDRKNYFYPDNPQNYQISQLYLPICRDGHVEIETASGTKSVGIHEIHMEEDAGKLIHDEWEDISLVDYNRSGVPLIEIVSEPDMRSADEVIAYLEKLRLIIQYLGASDCKLQEGSMRADVNLLSLIHISGEAVYSKEGKQQILEMVGRYMKNAHYILEGLKGAGYEVYGGVNSPYVWMKTPDRMTSWEFFDYLLEKANVVGTPGSGFGPSGEHYFRLTAFGSYENTVEAVERIKGI